MEEHASHAEGGEAGEVHHGSIWPFVLAVAGGLGFAGLATHELPLTLAGVAVLVLGVGGWLWEDAKGVSFVLKGTFEESAFAGISRRKLGMWIFLVSEIFFFTGLIGAGFTLRLRVPPCPAGPQACWPEPASPYFPLNIPLTAINTFILITSSLTMVEALHAAQKGNRSQMTEFHGAHVTGGIIALLFLNVKAWRGKYGKDDHEAIELVGLYWHFVDVVWIFLFPIMYLIGR